MLWLSSLLALPLAAQSDLGSYLGPGILGGAGGIGDRSGQQVDLRFWAGLNAVYTTSLQPLVTDSHGDLIHVPDLFGMSASFGAYGSHHWAHTDLSLSYAGNYAYYPNDSYYDGTNQSLALGLSMQYSTRVGFNLRLAGATLKEGTGSVADAANAGGSLTTPQVFDTRSSYLDITGSMSVMQSPRMSYTFGAGASGYYYQSSELTSSSGYHLNASANYRVSATSSFGGIYTYSGQMATGYTAQFQSVAGQYFGNWRRWSLSLTAGASRSHVTQSFSFQLPVINADGTIGLQSFPAQYTLNNFYPTGSVLVKHQFQRAEARATFSQGVGGGNGLVVAGRTDSATGGISYTGIRKWNLGADGRYTSAVGLTRPVTKTTWYGGGGGLTYEVARFTHLSAHFDVGRYDYGSGYLRTVKSASVGIMFAPGNIPLSLW